MLTEAEQDIVINKYDLSRKFKGLNYTKPFRLKNLENSDIYEIFENDKSDLFYELLNIYVNYKSEIYYTIIQKINNSLCLNTNKLKEEIRRGGIEL